LSEEAVEFAASGVEGALLVFPAVVDQRAAVLVDYMPDELFRGNLPQRGVFQIANLPHKCAERSRIGTETEDIRVWREFSPF
jgi:hypothetical protein